MDYGFNRSGALVDSGSTDCVYVLSEFEGRPVFHHSQHGLNTASMYTFGTLACWGIKSGFDWTAVLELIPDCATEEKRSLKEKLLTEQEALSAFVSDEIMADGISAETYEQLAELFSRLFPAYGHFEDRWNFLSDNFYSFDPDWNFQKFHTAPDFKVLITEAFGVYRKDLARAASGIRGSAISLLSRFSGSITAEQMVEIISGDVLPGSQSWGLIGTNLDHALRDLTDFDRLPRMLRAKLVRDLITRLQSDEDDGFTTVGIVEDTLAMLRSVADTEMKRFRSDSDWDQVHSRSVSLASDEEADALNPLYFPQEIIGLDGKELPEGMVLKLLRTPVDFLRAGNRSGLNNCMGKAGYYTKAKNGESYCLVGYSNAELVAGIELAKIEQSWKVLQLNGPNNSTVAGRRELEAELALMLNGELEMDDSRPIATETTADVRGDLELLEGVERAQKIIRELESIGDPVDIPPLAELRAEELDQSYLFGCFRAIDGEEQLEVVPRAMKLRDFETAVDGRRQPEHFAYLFGD